MLGSRAVNADTAVPAPPAPGADGPRRAAPIPRNVVALGWVSLLTDVSTEMIIPVLPLFVTGTLKASVASLGVIEGVAESTASLLRIGSGWLSDRIGRRKPFLMFGYGLSTVAKAGMGIAGSWGAVLALRFSDRVGKGLRNPPRDALIADSVEPQHLGRAFGFHRALDTTGAAIGPLAAFLMLRAFPGQYRRIFLASAVPAVLALVVIALFVNAPRHVRAAARSAASKSGALAPAYYRFLVVAGVFALASSSMAFLLLLASRVGIPADRVPLVYLVYNLVYAALSWPIGTLSDRIGRRPMLLAAYLLFALIYAALAWRATPLLVVGGFVLLGLHSALLEGSQRSLLGDLAARESRGTAFGLYYTVVGAALLPASALAGWLWQRFGTRATFGIDAALALVAALLFAWLLPSRGEWGDRHGAAAG